MSCISGWFWNISGIQVYLLDFRLVLKYLRNIISSPLFQVGSKISPKYTFISVFQVGSEIFPEYNFISWISGWFWNTSGIRVCLLVFSYSPTVTKSFLGAVSWPYSVSGLHRDQFLSYTLIPGHFRFRKLILS